MSKKATQATPAPAQSRRAVCVVSRATLKIEIVTDAGGTDIASLNRAASEHQEKIDALAKALADIGLDVPAMSPQVTTKLIPHASGAAEPDPEA